MFTPAERERVRDRLLEIAESDRRVISAAVVGSLATGDADRWSDIGSPNRGARGSRCCGARTPLPILPRRPSRGLRLGVVFARAARASIDRERSRQATFFISAVRDNALTLACLRRGLPTASARGVDDLPGAVIRLGCVAMAEEAFQPGAAEDVLSELETVLMAGGPLKNKRGHALLTNDRILFMDQRFAPAQAGAVGGWMAAKLAEELEKRRKERPPMVDFALTDITRVSHVTKLTVRDILVIETRAGETRFASGFKEWSPLLRRALTERHGRTVVDEGADAWSVTEANP